MVHLGSLQVISCTKLWIFKQIRNIWWRIPKMPEIYKKLPYKSYSREARAISRESWNETIVAIPGNREQEKPGMKH
jgi:hypothetical protein